MDPTACLRQLLEELSEPNPDRDEVADRLTDLTRWVARGGHLPQVTGHTNISTFTVGE